MGSLVAVLRLICPEVWDLSSLTRDRTHVPCIARQILNRWLRILNQILNPLLQQGKSPGSWLEAFLGPYLSLCNPSTRLAFRGGCHPDPGTLVKDSRKGRALVLLGTSLLAPVISPSPALSFEGMQLTMGLLEP